MMSPVRRRHVLPGRFLVLAVAMLGLAACELAVESHQRATGRGCETWQPGCPIVVDVAADGPALTTRSDARRADILGVAETAEVRVCPGWPNTCPVRTIGDVLVEQYFGVF
ncbi:MAG: hypothetical protein ACFCUO_00420 [Rhodospirillales bacterium]